jgi:SAM-dependent methyltransferase
MTRPTGPEPEEGFGAWYDEKQGDTGDEWHRLIIDPGLLGRLGELAPGTRLLDVGCGNGYLARRLARSGARVVGIDASEELIVRARAYEAREPLGIVYHRADAAHLPMLPDASFDVAIANMSLLDMEDAEGAIAEVGRLLAPRGRFVASLSHPCFDVDTRSAWSVEVGGKGPQKAPLIYRKVTGYRVPHADRYQWEIPPDRFVTTVGYHRPLAWYAHALRRAGFVIVDLDEPKPLAEYAGKRVRKEWIDEIPMHLIVEARREPTHPSG